MKLRLAMLIIFSSVYFSSKAQSIQYGFTTALNLNSISGKGMSGKLQPGFEAGVFAAIPLSKKISLQPELLYNLLKVSRSDNFTTYYITGTRSASKSTFNLAYLSIPILVNYHLTQMLTVNAGPQYNLLVYENENLFYDKNAFKKNDFGIRAGVQMTITPAFNLFASYYHGFKSTNAIDDRYDWKNKQLQIGLNLSLFGAR